MNLEYLEDIISNKLGEVIWKNSISSIGKTFLKIDVNFDENQQITAKIFNSKDSQFDIRKCKFL